MKLCGKHAVRTALALGRDCQKIWLSRTLNPAVMHEFKNLARAAGAPVQLLPFDQLDALCPGEHTQGIVAEVSDYRFAEWEEVLAGVQARGHCPFFVLVDRVQDPHNLGAIIRTADAAGVHCLVIPKHGAVGLTEGVARASAGAIERVPVARVTNLAQCIKALKEQGFWVAGLDMGGVDFSAVDLTSPLALVVGGEHAGLREQTRKLCDWQVRIPMRSQAASLNASVAAAIGMYEVVRQRGSGALENAPA